MPLRLFDGIDDMNEVLVEGAVIFFAEDASVVDGLMFTFIAEDEA